MSESQSSAALHRELDWARNMAGVERWGSLAAGGLAIAYGLTRRSRPRAWLTAAGTTLVYRGATGHCPVYSTLGVTTARTERDTRVALSGPRGISVHEADDARDSRSRRSTHSGGVSKTSRYS